MNSTLARAPSPVLIVGAGSSGLATALELRRHGQPVRIIDKATAPTTESRGTGLQARTLELLSLYGIADDIVRRANGLKALRFFLDGRPLGEVDFTANSSRFPYSPALPQAITEGVLRDRLEGAGVRVEWGQELTSLRQDEQCVTVQIRRADGVEAEASTPWLVACDGARSTVRNLLGLPFDGKSYPEGWSLMDAKIDWALPSDEIRVWRQSSGGQFIAVPLGNGIWRVQIDTRDTERDTELPTVEEMQAALQAATGLKARLSAPSWRAIFRVGCRQVSDYRTGRVLLAGDAAHVHTPAGGQGLNMGIQDGINLGWKLALVAQGHAGNGLIDSYQLERKPIAARVLELTEILARRPEAMVAGSGKSPRDHADAVGQLSHNYRAGPLAQAAGEPDGPGCVAGDRVADLSFGEVRLYEWLGRGGLVVVLLGGKGSWTQCAAQAKAKWGGLVRVWNLSETTLADSTSAAGFGITLSKQAATALQQYLGIESGAVVIRPDAYFGLVERGDPVEVLSNLDDYLERVLCLEGAGAKSEPAVNVN